MATRLSSERGKRLHPLAVRIMHWVNALAMIIMIGSGWKIYNDEVLFGWLHFPEWMTVGGEAQGALQWHFFAMWLLMANGLIYIGYGLFTGRFRRKLLPIRPREVLADVGEALRFRLSHQDITRYNAVQRLLYTGIILVIIVQVLSGWAVWKPIQLSELSALFSGFQGSRLVYFIGMAAIVAFIVIHVALSLIVPGPLHRHGRNCCLHRHSWRLGPDRAEDSVRDDHRQQPRRVHMRWASSS